MNILWPANACLRPPCRNHKPLVQICRMLDILPASKLARRSTRLYSISPIPWRHRSAQAKELSGRFESHNVRCMSDSSTRRSGQIITRFERLPQGYEDGEGIAFRATPLTRDEAHRIFGKVTDASSANQLLRVIHGRRVAGTLEDPNIPDMSTRYESRAYDVGLEWLRKNVPIDEVANAGLRAEQELAEMEGEILTDAQRLGIYQPNSGEYSQADGGVYGKGVFQKIREAEKERLDKKEAEEKLNQADEIRYNTGPLANVGRKPGVALREPGTNPKLLYYLEKGKVRPDDAPLPEMSAAQRLWPSGLLLVGVLAGCYVFVDVYTSPKKSARMWPDMPPSAATIISIIMINTAVFLAWRIPPLWRTLNKYFVHVPAYPYALSLIGNVFSHQTVKHIGLNMAVLWFVGTRLHDEVGRGNFLAIYVASGAVGSFASLTYRVALGSFITSSLGASGAICGVVGCYFLLNSAEKVTILGVFPPEDWPSISSMMLLLLLIAGDVYGLTRKGKGQMTDHFAHLGGYAVGMGSALALKDRLKKKRELEIERRKNLGLIDKIKEGRF